MPSDAASLGRRRRAPSPEVGESRLRPLRAGRSGSRLRVELPGPPDHHDPGRGHQSRSRHHRRRDRLPLRHRLRGLLRGVRPPAGAPGGRLEPPLADRPGPQLLVGDDRALWPRAELRPARQRPGRRRRRRGERHTRGLLDVVRFLLRCARVRRCSRSTRAGSTSARVWGS